MPPYSESLLLLISTVVGLFCLCPLFTINNENIASVDSNVIPLVEALLDNRAASWASLFIVVIPIIDLLLDLPSHIESYFFGGGNHSKKCPDSLVVVRLSDIERFLFIIGVAAQSAAAFLPATTNVETLALVHRCTYNFSLLMVLSPVETFLGRCTSTFSHSLVSIVILTSSAAFFITTLSYYLEAGSSNRYALTLVGLLLLSVVGILNFGTACLCFYKYLWDGAKLSLIFQQCHIKSLMKLLKGNSYMMNTDVVLPNLKKSELYTHFIPGLHMVSVLIIGFAHDYAPETQQNITYQERHYVTLFAQVMVLVIELRIRKNEIARGLVSRVTDTSLYCHHLVFLIYLTFLSPYDSQLHIDCLTGFQEVLCAPHLARTAHSSEYGVFGSETSHW